jgi:endonuclease-3
MEWDKIFTALESWRGELRRGDSGNTGGEPSVSALAAERQRDPWAVLVSTILSLRTKDEVTRITSRALLARAPDPASYWALPEEEAVRLAYPAGFYRTKAANLKKIARILLDDYGGRVPSDMEKLLALPGVGRKTANLVLTEAFDMDGICVDIHVHRICNRAGWVNTLRPDQTEECLRQILPKKYWKGINALLVRYGQQICRPVSPFCSRCVIPQWCGRREVTRAR